MPVIDFLIQPFLFLLGLLLHAFKPICHYAESIKCPVFVACWGFIKSFFRILLTTGSYKDKEYDEEKLRRGNEYIDKLFEDMFQSDKYDPYKMEGTAVGFNKKIVFVNVSGEAKFHNGYIIGLSTLHRAEDCSLHEEGGRLRVKADLGAGELKFQYSGSAKFMNLGPTIQANGILSYIEVRMEFTVDSKTGRNGKLEKFIIDDMRGMKVWVTGLGPINWALNPIVSGVTKIFKRFVRNFMENKVEKHLDKTIPNFQFPVEGGESTTQDPVINNSSETTNPTEESKPTSPEPNPTEPETNPTEESKPTSPEPNPTEPETNPTEESKQTSPEPNPTEPETNPTEESKPTSPEPNPTEAETKPPTEPEETLPSELETIAPEESEDSNPSDSETNAQEEVKEINSPQHSAPVEEVSYLQLHREFRESSSGESSSDESPLIIVESE